MSWLFKAISHNSESVTPVECDDAVDNAGSFCVRRPSLSQYLGRIVFVRPSYRNDYYLTTCGSGPYDLVGYFAPEESIFFVPPHGFEDALRGFAQLEFEVLHV